MGRVAWPAGLAIGVLLWMTGCGGGQPPFRLDPIYNPPGQTLSAGTLPVLPVPSTPYPALSTAPSWGSAAGTQRADSNWTGSGPHAPQQTSLRLSGAPLCAPVHGSDGLWHVIAGRKLLAFNASGVVQSEHDIDLAYGYVLNVLASPAGDQLYVSEPTSFEAFDLTGHQLWLAQPGSAAQLQLVAVSTTGHVLAAMTAGDGRRGLRLYDAAGTQLWEFTPPAGASIGESQLSAGDRVYALQLGNASTASQLIALDSGQVAWSTPLTHLPQFAPGTNSGALLSGLDHNLYVETATIDGPWEGEVGPPTTVYLEGFSTAGTALGVHQVGDSSHPLQIAAVLADGSWLATAWQAQALQDIHADGTVVWQLPGITSVGAVYPSASGSLLVDGATATTPMLLRIGPAGQLLWQRGDFSGLRFVTPQDDGGALAASSLNLTGVGPAGETRFALPCLNDGLTYLRTDSAGNSYGVDGGVLVSFDAQLQRRWQATLPGADVYELLLSAAGVAVAVGGNWFAVYSPSGAALTSVPVPGVPDYPVRSALLGADNTLYLAGMNNRQIAAYALDGTHLWTYTDETAVDPLLALDSAGNLYCYSLDFNGAQQSLFTGAVPSSCALISLGRNGQRRFRLELGALPAARPRRLDYQNYARPMVEASGSVLVSLATGSIVRCSADGSSLTTLAAPAGCTLVCPRPDGGLLAIEGVAPTDPYANFPPYGDLLSLNADGSLRWRAATGDSSGLSIVWVDAAGTVCLHLPESEQLLAVDSAGHTLFTQSVASPSGAYGNSIAIAPDALGGIIVGSGDELRRLGD